MPIYLHIPFAALFFILGAVIGSIIDLFIHRISRKEPLFKSGFHCDFCGAKLGLLKSLPIAGWIISKGKCGKCGKKIPVNYIVSELGCAVLYLVSYLVLGLETELIFALVLSPVLVILSVTDIMVMEIPYSCSISVAVLGLISIFTDSAPWYEHLIGAAVIGLPFAVLAFLGVMGGGDFQLMAAAGLLLGWRIVPAAVIGIVLGAIGGLAIKLVTKSDTIRFGPFLAVGIFCGYLFGTDIINFYIGLIR